MPLNQYVPHLSTALTGPLLELEQLFFTHKEAIERWFAEHWQHTPPTLTSSVDIRNAGFKMAPVDTNLFPAGWNNLHADFLPRAGLLAKKVFPESIQYCQNILLIAESHTRNPFYYHSLATLKNIIQDAGFNVRVGSVMPQLTQTRELSLTETLSLTLEPVIKKNNKAGIEGFTPCLVLLNHDLSEGIPELLNNIEQTIRPPIELSWQTRTKSQHFSHYQNLSQQLANILQCDPWLLSPLFAVAKNINFIEREGEEELLEKATQLFKDIQKKYDEHNIKDKPFLVIKADSGTYGMGVMMIHSVDELKQLNRKQRKKMSASKGGQGISQVILQEGIPSIETLNNGNAVAEPVVYHIGQFVAGSFYRVHADRNKTENLNAPGMVFEPLMAVPGDSTEEKNRFYAYGVISRLAALAAAQELKEAMR